MAENSPLLDIFFGEKARQLETRREAEENQDPYAIVAPSTVGEVFGSQFRAGVAQIEGDISRFGAIGNLLIGDEEAAQASLNRAEFRDQEFAQQALKVGTFEELVNDPSLANIWEQAVVQTGRLAPMAISSIASSGAGFVAGLLARYGVRKAGLAASKEIIEELLKKKLAGATLDKAENALLRSAAVAAKLPTAGAIAGLFTQEYVVGSSQALSEYQEAGIEITQHEAAISAILGVPQAMLGTIGEVFIVKALFKQAIKRSVLGQTLNKARKGQKLTADQQKIFQLYEKRAAGASLMEAEMLTLRKAAGSGTFVGALVGDLARAFGRSAVVEGTIEMAQEGAQIAQRFAIDDDYTAAQAKLRIGEAAFAGFVAGGALGGTGGGIASVFSSAKDMVERGFEQSYRSEARAQQYGKPTGHPLPETQEQLDAQAAAVEDPGIDKDAVWVSIRTDGKEPLIPTFADLEGVIAIKTPTGTLYTTNQAKAQAFDTSSSSGPTEEQLRDVLGYTAVKDESHDRVVRILNKDGQIVSDETTNQEGARVAIRNANKRIKDKDAGYVVESEMLEQAVRERNMDNMGDASEISDAEVDDAGTQGVTIAEADVQQTGGVAAQEGVAGAFEYVRNDDGEVALYQASGKASEAKKAEFLELLTAEEQLYWTTRSQDGSRRIDSLSDGAIKRYLSEVLRPTAWVELDADGNQVVDETTNKPIVITDPKVAADLKKAGKTLEEVEHTGTPGDVFLTEYTPGFYAIGRSGIAEAPAIDAEEVLRRAKTKAKQTAYKLDADNELVGWQLVETDAEGNTTTSDVNIQDLVIAGRTLSEQGDSDASYGQQIARGFGALLAALDEEGSFLTYKGKPANEAVMKTAPVFFQWGKTYTLRQLNNLPRKVPTPESVQELEDSITEEGNYTSEDLVNETLNRHPDLQEETEAAPTADPAAALADKVKADPRYLEVLEDIAFQEGIDTSAVKSGVVERGTEEVPTEIRTAPRAREVEDDVEVTQDVLDESARKVAKLREEGNETASTLAERGYEVGDTISRTRSTILEGGEESTLSESEAMASQAQEATGPSTERVNPTRLDIEESGRGWTDTSQRTADPTYRERSRKGPERVDQGVSYSQAAAAAFTEDDAQGGSNLLSNLRRIIEKNFGFKRRVKIITVDDSATFVFSRDTTYVTEDGTSVDPNALIRAKQDEMLRTGRRGKIISFGNMDIIILNIPKTNGQVSSQDLYTAVLAIGHELGHSLFVQEINKLVDNPNLWKVLNKEFEKAQARVGSPYTGEYGFEEWYADQMALFLFDLGKKPGNGTEGYFKRLANKLHKFYRDLHRVIQQRFGNGINPEFNNYAQQVVQSYKEGRTAEEQPLETLTRVRIRNMVGQLGNVAEQTIGKKNARKLMAEAKRILAGVENNIPENMRHWNVKWLLLPAHNYLVKVGGKELAGFFYSRSQSTDKTGILNYRILVINRYLSTLWDLVDAKIPGDPTRAEVQTFTQYLYEAEQENINTEDLSPKAQEVRKWLDTFFETYVSPNNPNIKKRRNFFSRQLDLSSIENSPAARAELVNVLKTYNKGVSDTLLNKVVEDLIRNEERSDLDVDESGSDLAIGMGVERAKLFTNIPNEALRRGVDANGNIRSEGDAGILIVPDQAIRKYVEDMVKRTVYNDKAKVTLTMADVERLKDIKGFKGIPHGNEVSGWRAVETLLQRIPDPIDRQGARDAVKAMLGKTGLGMKPWQRNLNSWGMFLNVVTYLTFSVLASLPDLAGPMLRSKEFASLGVGVRQLQHYFSNKGEMQQFARDVGVVTFDSLATMYVNASEMNFMTERAKQLTDGFFRVTGTEAFTKFTRTFALGMGEQFLLTHAGRAKKGDKLSISYLNELQVGADDVIKWAEKERKTGKGGTRRSFETAEGQKVRDALGRFVDESIIRPNAAERPVWASNPYTALIWQLKSFFYAYGKNIIGGAMRGVKNNYAVTGDLGMAAVPLVIGAMTLLPLTMVGLELRELIKYLFSGIDPFQGGGIGGFNERKLASNNMSYGEYSYEMVDRGGYLGAFGLLLPLLSGEASRYGGFSVAEAFALGPTAERLEDLVKGDVRLKKYVPFYASF